MFYFNSYSLVPGSEESKLMESGHKNITDKETTDHLIHHSPITHPITSVFVCDPGSNKDGSRFVAVSDAVTVASAIFSSSIWAETFLIRCIESATMDPGPTDRRTL